MRGVVVFLAGYLERTRALLTVAQHRVGPLLLPAPRHLAPLATAVLLSLGVLVVQKDLGSSLLLFGIVKTKALENGGGTGLGRPGIDIGKPGLDIGNARRIGGGVGLFHECGAFGIGGQNRVNQGDIRRGHFLGDATDAGVPGQGDGAGFQRQFTPDQAEQRGLSGSVPTDKANLVTIGDDGGGLFKKRATFDGVIDF